MIVRLSRQRMRQRHGQERIDLLGKEEADQEAQHKRGHGIYQPLAQLDQMVEQRRLRRLDLVFIVRRARGHDVTGGSA